MKSAQPFLMFQGHARAALDLYVEVLGARVERIERYGSDGPPGAEGTIKLATLRVGELSVLCSDSPVKHAFDFTPSSSIFIECESRAELERLFEALSSGGQVLMPPDDYGFSTRFGWCNDRYGVSWQLNLSDAA